MLTKLFVPVNEKERLAELRKYNLLLNSADDYLNNITQVIASVFDVPTAAVSLVGEHEVYLAAAAGMDANTKVPRGQSICAHTITGTSPLVIGNMAGEPLLAGHQTNNVAFYAGAPLTTPTGCNIGALFLADSQPRSFSAKETQQLQHFATLVMQQMELRLAIEQQHKKAEEQQAIIRELQFITDSVPQLAWATEPDGNAYFFNKGWEVYTGLSAHELLGSGWLQTVHPHDYDATRLAWNRAVTETQQYDVEYRLRDAEGGYRWFVARGTPIRNAAGQVIKWYGTTTDIHDQKLAHQMARQSEERFELVSKATQDAIWDWNLLTDQVWWNEGFKEKFGYKAEEIENSSISWYGRLHPDDKDRVVTSIHDIIDNGGKLWNSEYRFRKADGTYAIVFDRGYALHNDAGKPYRMLGSMQDVTALREQQQETRKNVQRFAAAVQAVQGILWTNNARGEMEGEQKGWSQLTGQTYHEYQGYGWAKAVHPHDAQPTINAWNLAVAEKRRFVFEHRVKKKDGTWGLYSITAVPILDAEGTIVEWVGVHTDITSQREAEEKIRQSERRFNNLVKEATVGIILLKGEDMVVDIANEAYARLIGRTASELLRRPIFDIIPEAAASFKQVIQDVRATGEPSYFFERPYQVNNGDKTFAGYLNLVYQPYHEPDQTVSGVMVLCHDVTAQVIARRQKEEADVRAALAIEAAGMGTFSVHLPTGELVASQRLSELVGLPETCRRRQYMHILHPDDFRKIFGAFKKALHTGALEFEGRVVLHNNALRWMRIKGKVEYNEVGGPLKLVGVVQDITEEKEFAEELGRQVKMRMAELEQFTYVSHHDLQEPLRKILLFTDKLKKENQHNPALADNPLLNKIHSAAKRMSAALGDLLNFAALNKQEQVQKTDLSQVFYDVKSDLEVMLTEKQATLQHDPLPRLWAVPHQMHQLLYNLLNNALKFTKPGVAAHIRLTCQLLKPDEKLQHPALDPQCRYYRFAVTDNGIGFSQEHADKIFVMFQRLHNRETYSGTGIGLALCKKVVANHRGLIWATGNPGEGASFTFILPAHPAGNAMEE